jgi:hypothetical protein
VASAPVSRVLSPPDPPTTGLSLTVDADDGDKFPQAPFTALVWRSQTIPDAANSETLTVTSVEGDEFSLVRSATPIAIFRDLAIAAVALQDVVPAGATATARAAFGQERGPYELSISSPSGSASSHGTATAFQDDHAGNVSYNFEADPGGQWTYRWLSADGRSVDGRVFAEFDPAG